MIELIHFWWLLICDLRDFQTTFTITVIYLFGVLFICLFIVYLGFYVAFNTVQVISRRVVGRAEETSTYSSLGFCTVNCRPTASNYQLSHLRPWRGSNPGCRGGRRECYHSATVAPTITVKVALKILSSAYWKLEADFIVHTRMDSIRVRRRQQKLVHMASGLE